MEASSDGERDGENQGKKRDIDGRVRTEEEKRGCLFCCCCFAHTHSRTHTQRGGGERRNQNNGSREGDEGGRRAGGLPWEERKGEKTLNAHNGRDGYMPYSVGEWVGVREAVKQA